MTVRIEYQNNGATDKDEHEIVKKYRALNLADYRSFKDALYNFWQCYNISGQNTSCTSNKVWAIELNFFGEGLTDALVFRAEVFPENCRGSSFIRVMKYDTFENIQNEVARYHQTASRRGHSVFPGLETYGQIHPPHSNGMALLSMRSVIDSVGASYSHTLIQYILEKYSKNKDYLNLYGDKISVGLALVYENMSQDFYIRCPNQGFSNGKTLYQYFCENGKGKISLNVLDKKTDGAFSVAYENCKSFLVSELDLQLPIAEEFFKNIICGVKNTPVLLATHAIHGDFNPNNILMAVTRKDDTEVIDPMVIDFMEIKFREKIDAVPNAETWVPLFYDPARLEAELMIRYFHILGSRNKLSISDIWQGMKLVLECLHQGHFMEIHSPVPEKITDNELNYIFRIIYHFRARIFDARGGIADIEGYYRRTAMINYIWCVMAFCFFYLKFTKEENIEDKKPLALAMAGFYRCKLPELLDLNIDSCYSKTRMQTLGFLPIQGRMEALTRHYIDIQDEVKQVISFVLSDDKKHLLITGSPGSGKTSLASYLTRLLNGDINLPEYLKEDKERLDNIFCIPYFSGEMRYVRTSKDGHQESGENALTWFSEKLVSLFPELALTVQDNESTAIGQIFNESRPNLLERFKILLQTASRILIEREQKIIFLIDALDVYKGSIEEFLLAEFYPHISFVYTSRPETTITNKIAFLRGYAEPIELAFFTMPDLTRYLFRIELALASDEVALLFEKSSGWQIYIEKTCEILRDAEDKMQTLEDLPPEDIDLIYEMIINNKITGAEEKVGWAVLFTLSQAMEPLDMDQLIVINREYLKKACMMPHIQKGLAMCRQLIRVTETGAYSIFHDTAKDYVMSTYKEDLKAHQKVFSACIEHTLTQPEQNALFGYALRNAGIHLYSWGMEDRLVNLLKDIYGSNNGKEGAYYIKSGNVMKPNDEILLNLLDYQIPKEPNPKDSRLKKLIEKVVENLPYRRIGHLLLSVPFQYSMYMAWAICLYDNIILLFKKLLVQPHFDEDICSVASAYGNRGNALLLMGDQASVESYGLAIGLMEELKGQYEAARQKFPPDFHHLLACNYISRGSALLRMGDQARSVESYGLAIGLMEKLKGQYEESRQKFPPGFQNNLASVYMRRGNALIGQDELTTAMDDYGLAIGLMEELKAQYEENRQKFPPVFQNNYIFWQYHLRTSARQKFPPEFQNNLAGAYMRRGIALEVKGELAAAMDDHGLAIGLMEELKAQYEESQQKFPPGFQNNLAGAYMSRGIALQVKGELAAAMDDYGLAINLMKEIKGQYEESRQKFPPGFQNLLASAYANRGNALQVKGELTAAMADHGLAIGLMEELKGQYEAARHKFPPEFQNNLAILLETVAEGE